MAVFNNCLVVPLNMMKGKDVLNKFINKQIDNTRNVEKKQNILFVKKEKPKTEPKVVIIERGIRPEVLEVTYDYNDKSQETYKKENHSSKNHRRVNPIKPHTQPKSEEFYIDTQSNEAIEKRTRQRQREAANRENHDASSSSSSSYQSFSSTASSAYETPCEDEQQLKRKYLVDNNSCDNYNNKLTNNQNGLHKSCKKPYQHANCKNASTDFQNEKWKKRQEGLNVQDEDFDFLLPSLQ